MNTKHLKTIVGLMVASHLSGADIIDYGSAPEKWTPAKKNTPLGQEVLGYTANDSVPVDQGRIIFNTRFRYEYGQQGGLASSDAFTLRTRIGYETPKYYGFYGLGEFENTWALNLSDYQAYLPSGGRTIIADPRNNQLNQLFAGYSGYNSDFKGGRQVINLDNQRFVGSVGWRQNDQTFDAARLTTEIIKDTWLSYTYAWQANRIFGVYAPVTAQERFQSQSHFLNVHYDGLPVGELAAYMYYLDLGSPNNPLAQGSGVSSTTAGLFYKGDYSISDDWSLPFRAEFAFQTDNGATAPAQGGFTEYYWHTKIGATYQKKYTLGFGFESLGGNGTRGFSTPLATLHKFNGWADRFLGTPPNGLNDFYIFYTAMLPYKLKLFGAAHYFTAENSSDTYGKEFDVGLGRKLTDNLSALVKFAYYDGNGAGPQTGNAGLASDATRLWIQVDFSL